MASNKQSRQGSAEKLVPIPHTRIDDDKAIEDIYLFGQKLGQGSFGVVREVFHKETNERWACKAVNKEKAGSSAIKLLEREVAILKRVSHEHIIRLKEVLETPKRMYLIMEFCEGGELTDVLKEKKYFEEAEAKIIMERLASAISYLHKHDTVHRDLKLENILLSKSPTDRSDYLYIKVTDFGLSIVRGGVGHENMMQDFCGTLVYMAPEIIDNKTYSEKCDVWAMGCIMYKLLSGNLPFHSSEEEKLYEIIKKGELDFSGEVWEAVTDEAKACLQGLLTVDPAHRLTASETLYHPWIKGQSLESAQGPKNVLEMMKEWASDLKNKDSDEEEDPKSAINGEGSSQGNGTAGDGSSQDDPGSASSSRGGSASSGKKGKNSGGTQRTPINNNNGNHTNAKKPLTKASTEKSIKPPPSSRTTQRSNTMSNIPAQRGIGSKSRSPVSGVKGGSGSNASKPAGTVSGRTSATPANTRSAVPTYGARQRRK